MVHDNTGVSVGLMPGGLDEDVSGRGLTHGYSLEAPVMQQGITKDRRAENMFRLCPKDDRLFCRLCE
jgi:hypothetical protein